MSDECWVNSLPKSFTAKDAKIAKEEKKPHREEYNIKKRSRPEGR